jgi:hypothetical protein
MIFVFSPLFSPLVKKIRERKERERQRGEKKLMNKLST